MRVSRPPCGGSSPHNCPGGQQVETEVRSDAFAAWRRTGRNPPDPVVVFAIVGRMRLRSSRPVVEAAERLMGVVVETYRSPNLTFAEIHAKFKKGEEPDPLSDFGEACRKELEGLRI